MLGDFDINQLWQRGPVTVLMFLAAILVGNVALLNLLIAIVSDEFEKYMEGAELEAVRALGDICQEARVVKGLDGLLIAELGRRATDHEARLALSAC